MYVCMYVCMYTYMALYASLRAASRATEKVVDTVRYSPHNTYSDLDTYIYIYIYICICADIDMYVYFMYIYSYRKAPPSHRFARPRGLRRRSSTWCDIPHILYKVRYMYGYLYLCIYIDSEGHPLTAARVNPRAAASGLGG